MSPSIAATVRDGIDMSWHDLLDSCGDGEVSVERDAMDPCDVLFSSGTTGEPKAIVCSHSTPVKVRRPGGSWRRFRENAAPSPHP